MAQRPECSDPVTGGCVASEVERGVDQHVSSDAPAPERAQLPRCGQLAGSALRARLFGGGLPGVYRLAPDAARTVLEVESSAATGIASQHCSNVIIVIELEDCPRGVPDEDGEHAVAGVTFDTRIVPLFTVEARL